MRSGQTYRAVGVLEHLKHAAHLLPDGSASSLEDGLSVGADSLPELLLLGAGDEGDADGLGVVGGGGEGEDRLDDLLDAAVGDGRGVLEAVDGAAVLGGGEPVESGDLGGRHFDVDGKESGEYEEKKIEDCRVTKHSFFRARVVEEGTPHYLYTSAPPSHVGQLARCSHSFAFFFFFALP